MYGTRDRSFFVSGSAGFHCHGEQWHEYNCTLFGIHVPMRPSCKCIDLEFEIGCLAREKPSPLKLVLRPLAQSAFVHHGASFVCSRDTRRQPEI